MSQPQPPSSTGRPTRLNPRASGAWQLLSTVLVLGCAAGPGTQAMQLADGGGRDSAVSAGREDAYQAMVEPDAAPRSDRFVSEDAHRVPGDAHAIAADVGPALDQSVAGDEGFPVKDAAPPPSVDVAFAGGAPDAVSRSDVAPPDALPAVPPDAAVPDLALPDAALPCVADLECPPDAVCFEGACHAGGIACAADGDCRPGDLCRLGFCAPTAAACHGDADCVAGELCDGLACGPAQCLGDADCVAPAVCAAGRCGIPGAVEVCNGLDDDGNGAIDDGTPCPDGQICRQGACVDAECVDGATRLVGGASDSDGRLEICLRGVWGTVCLAGFDGHAAAVACRSTGLPDGAARAAGAPPAAPNANGRPIWIAGLHCAGAEASLLDCPPNDALGAACTHGHDVGLSCPPGPPPEVCNGVDDNGDGQIDEGNPCPAGALCRAGVCLPVAPESCNGVDDDLDGVVDNGTLCPDGQACRAGACVAFAPETCNGVDDDLDGTVDNGDLCPAGQMCRAGACVASGPETCNGLDDDLDGRVDDGALCGIAQECFNGACRDIPCDEGRTRLVNGPSAVEGRVEICHAGQWGTVCDDSWGKIDAEVVCRELGMPWLGATAYSRATYGAGPDPILLDEVGCGGNENHLVECANLGWGVNDCLHSEDAGVACADPIPGQQCREGDVRLMDGWSATSGRVEICHQGIWGTVCDDGFTDIEASVVCGQLGFPTAGAWAYGSATFGEGVDPIWLDDVICDGVEASLSACFSAGWGNNNCSHAEDVGVDCGF